MACGVPAAVNANEIPYVALRPLRLVSKGVVSHIERGDIFSFDGDEGVDVSLLLKEKAIRIYTKPIPEVNSEPTTRESM